MNLKHYINQIKLGKPINFSRFILLLPELYNKKKHEIFELTLLAPQKWQVKCANSTIVELEEFTQKPESRVQAAEMGNSHLVRVTSGFLLVYHQLIKDSRPDVVYLEQDSHLQGFQSKQQLLIVENEENFFLPKSMLKLATAFLGNQIDFENTDIVLGSGARATSVLARTWYQQYSHIFCAFDYDLAGLKMYRTLKRCFSGQLHFLQPNDYSVYEHCFKMSPKSYQKLNECIEMAKQLGFLELSEIIKRQRKFMEQEMLLVEMDDE